MRTYQPPCAKREKRDDGSHLLACPCIKLPCVQLPIVFTRKIECHSRTDICYSVPTGLEFFHHILE